MRAIAQNHAQINAVTGNNQQFIDCFPEDRLLKSRVESGPPAGRPVVEGWIRLDSGLAFNSLEDGYFRQNSGTRRMIRV